MELYKYKKYKYKYLQLVRKINGGVKGDDKNDEFIYFTMTYDFFKKYCDFINNTINSSSDNIVNFKYLFFISDTTLKNDENPNNITSAYLINTYKINKNNNTTMINTIGKNLKGIFFEIFKKEYITNTDCNDCLQKKYKCTSCVYYCGDNCRTTTNPKDIKNSFIVRIPNPKR